MWVESRRGGTRGLVAVADGRARGTVGELADALGLPPGQQLRVDDEVVPAETPLSSSPVVHGSVIDHGDVGPSSPAAATIELAVVAGPDAGQALSLDDRSAVVIGRDTSADLRLDNPTVSSRHAVIRRVGERITVEDVGSRNGTWLRGEHDADDVAIDGLVELTVPACLRLGSIDVAVRVPDQMDRPMGVDPVHADESGRVLVNRPPRPPVPENAPPIVVPDGQPDRPNPFFSPLALIAPIVFGVVMVLVLGSWRYALFAVLSPLMLLSGWLTNRRRVSLQRRADAETFTEGLARFEAELGAAATAERHRRAAIAPDPGEVLRRATLPSVRLWERRAVHEDALQVRIRRGRAAWCPAFAQPVGRPVAPAEPCAVMLAAHDGLEDAPLVADLGSGPIGIIGDAELGDALVRSLLLQLCTHHGPADLSIVIVADETRTTSWEWARWLPHLRGSNDALRILPPSAASEFAAVLDAQITEHSAHRWLFVVDDVADGPFAVDLVADGPHALVAGTTGAGKSELLRTWLLGLASAHGPSDVVFVLVDYKGGAAFDALRDLPHTVGLVTDLDAHLAERALRSLEAELRHRERLLADAGCSDFAAYRRAEEPGGSLPRLVVVIDEFATLRAELPDFVDALVGIAQRGRSLGVHLVLATQRPAGAVDANIRANTNLRIALRVQTDADSLDVIDDRVAVEIPRSLPGRWLPDLPATLGPAALDALAAVSPDVIPLAVGDDPDRQRRTALGWAPATGSVVVLGAVGSGVSTTLVSVGARLQHGVGGRDAWVFAADHGDGSLQPLADRPHVSCVLDASDEAGHSRLLDLLEDEVAERVRTGGAGPIIVVLVDGMGGFLDRLDAAAGGQNAERLARIVRDGPGLGVVFAAGASRPADLPKAMLAGVRARIILSLADPLDLGVLGVRRRTLPAPRPGRALFGADEMVAQIVDQRELPGPTTASVPPSVAPLERSIPLDTLGAAAVGEDGLVVPVGVDSRSRQVAQLRLRRGEHALIAGPPGSGRTTALRSIAVALRAADPDLVMVAVVGAGSPLIDDGPAGPFDAGGDLADVAAVLDRAADDPARRWVVFIDDAERCGDESELLHRILRVAGSVHAIAAVRTNASRSDWPRWLRSVRSSGVGVLLQADPVMDGELLSVRLPRGERTDIPGRGWLVHAGSASLVQLAHP